MKRILIATGIYYPDIGGPATYAKMLSEHLGSEFQVSVLAYSRTLPGFPKFIRNVVYALKIRSQAQRADVIYALSTLGVGMAAARAARRYKKKFLVRVAGDRVWEDAVNAGQTNLLVNDFQHFKKMGRMARRQKLQAWVCGQAETVITPSQYLADMVAGWGVDRQKIHVIYNSVEGSTFDETKEEARKKIGIPGTLLVTAGRLVPWKGFRLLIKLMPQLLEINPFFRLVVVGEGPDRGHLETMIRNLGLQQKIYLVGKKPREELQRYLVAAELFILNTGYEGFSHQIIEVMQCGVPVITTLVGGNREVIKQGENGFMVKYNDEFNVLEAIKTLWADPELRTSFIMEGKKTAAQFTVDRMIEETKKLL